MTEPPRVEWVPGQLTLDDPLEPEQAAAPADEHPDDDEPRTGAGVRGS